MTPRLEPGYEIRCPQCHHWDAVIHKHAEGTDYTIRMLYFRCNGGDYYAGQLGTMSRHETRTPKT